MTNNFSKLIDIKNALNAKYFEREKEIEAILIALLSKQHMLMIGSPGTAKSALAADLAKIVQGMGYFQWLLTRFSTPEELFGALSLKDLENGVYKRNTANKMPEAHIAFLDEIFKSNSAILNSLLTLINERVFYNNGHPITVPLMSVVGSSNEYPEEGEGLEALFDRFLLRFEVDYIGDDNNFISMMKGNGQNQPLPSLTMEELVNLQFFTEMVSVPDEVYVKLAEIRYHLKDEGIRPSDRRFKQSLSVLKAKALIAQRQHVITDDIVFLENSLWESPDQKELTSNIVRTLAQDTVLRAIENADQEAKEILTNLNQAPSTEASLEAVKKVKALLSELENLKAKNPNRNVQIQEAIDRVTVIHREIASSVLDPIN
ncbi:MoxR-like ATPase [Bacillus thermophilus]|uniref:MoxR-like ATPase n=1 Tax=Siminovitchia thermophila TaxID=1245522 RepID=A0ABS2R6X5_9BACI|nr:AAA family ATPase [Siminovitchia thermophila]MBM7715373.1 MoxR-like ATPase [Siminovitchia thermophila]